MSATERRSRQHPRLIGVGEASERIDAPGYAALSPAELAGRARGRRAGRRRRAGSWRRTSTSSPRSGSSRSPARTPCAPFGASDNFRALGRQADRRRSGARDPGAGRRAGSAASGQRVRARHRGGEARDGAAGRRRGDLDRSPPDRAGEKRDWSETRRRPARGSRLRRHAI